MARLGWRVRLKDTHITGTIYSRVVEGGESWHRILWDDTETEDTRLYKTSELESVDFCPGGDGPKYWMIPALDRQQQAFRREAHDREGAFEPPKTQTGYKRV